MEDINDENIYELKFNELSNNYSSSSYYEIGFYFRKALYGSNIVKNVEFEGRNIKLNRCHIYFLNKLNSQIDSRREEINSTPIKCSIVQ